jgi:autotransporter passenger strand-loop-strand repeat protein
MTTLGSNDQYITEWIYAAELQLEDTSGNISTIAGVNTDGGVTVDLGGGQLVEAGGTALNTTVNVGGDQFVYAGGTAINTMLTGGYQTVSAGGVASGTIINSGFENVVGGTADSTIVQSGTITVAAGGIDSSTQVDALGSLERVDGGGTAYSTTVYYLGIQEILTADFNGTAIAINTTLSGGIQEVGLTLPGDTAIASDTQVSTGGVQEVFLGGLASGTMISSGGFAEVFSGGTITDPTISSGGILFLFSGASASGEITFADPSTPSISGGGELIIYGSAMPSATISGFAPGDTIDLASMNFSSGGAVFLSGSNVLTIVESGGTATLQLDPSQSFSGLSFKLSSDGNSGTVIEVRSGLLINLTFDPNVSDAPPDFKDAMTSATSYFEDTFSNAATLNIDVGWGTVNGGAISTGAARSVQVGAPNTYTFGQIAGGDLYLGGHSDVTSGGAFFVGEAEAKALGLVSGNVENTDANKIFDGYVGFNAADAWGVEPGQIYLVGAAEHEISEVMGRLDFLSSTVSGTVFPYYSVLDLFRYSAPNVPDITRVPPAPYTSGYFSIDSGTTNLATFNTKASVAKNPSGDLGDWDNVLVPGDPYDASATYGLYNPATSLDAQVMNAIGWNTAGGAIFTVMAGTIDTGTVIASGDLMSVQADAIESSSMIAPGGAEEVYGNDNSGIVEGTMVVYGGGTAVGTTIQSGGFEYVYSAGTANDTAIAGGGVLELGGPTEIDSNGGEDALTDLPVGNSSVLVSDGGLAEIAASNASGFIAFAGVGATLRIDGTTPGDMPSAVISGFMPGNTVDLAGVGFDITGSIKLTSSNVLAVTENGTTYDFQLDPSQNFAGWDFKLSSDGATGTDIRLGGQSDDFDFDRTSDILFRNDSSGDTWFEAMSNGSFNGWHQIGGSNTIYATVGVGDFYGTRTSDALFRNTSTGDTWIETISNGAFAGWNQIGGSDTHYAAVGVGDFFGNATDDILFRNNSNGDTWFEAISNGAFNGWHQVGGSSTTYAAVGIGDFFGNGTDDILFRNNLTGDTWIEAISNGAFNGWHQIGGSDTHYSVVGVGDFTGNGIDDILFRNNSSGDTWIETISNGAFKSWQQVGGSNTTYVVAAIGDYFGNGTDDILFRNNSTGDTWFEAISNGAFNGWHQVGGSNTSYTVKT